MNWAFWLCGLTLALHAFADPACPEPKPSLNIGGREVIGDIMSANQMPYGEYAHFSKKIPGFLQKHIGDGPDQISKVVLDRARALFRRDRKAGASKNVCYVAVDATRPFLLNEKAVDQGAEMKTGNRLYLICESLGVFKALPVAHGGGVDLSAIDKTLNLKNGKRCSKYFGNVMNSFFTMGGNYTTGTLIHSFKGKIEQKDGSTCDFSRPFLNMVGEKDSETGNAADREIGAHPVILIGDGKDQCKVGDPRADKLGYVYVAHDIRNYNGGRTEGCLGMPEDIAATILAIGVAQPMSIYVYPQKRDILRLAANDGKPKPYWNADCLKEIGTPVYFAAGTSDKLESAIKEKARLAAKRRAEAPPEPPPPPCPGVTIPSLNSETQSTN